MIIATYSQGRKLQNHIAYIRRCDNPTSPDFGKYNLDIVKEYGTSRNNHGLDRENNLIRIEQHLKDAGFTNTEDTEQA